MLKPKTSSTRHASVLVFHCHPGHPRAQIPRILGLVGSKDLKEQGLVTLRPPFRGALDVEGYITKEAET